MKFGMFTILLLFPVSGILAQEICDNGIDDNGNGLIDLNDPACICSGIGVVENDVTFKIPNTDFEQMDCCPDFISQVDACLSAWVAPTTATPDYMNTCDFMMGAVYEANLYPFPSGGEGIVGISAANNWREYIGVCLNGTLMAGIPHAFTIQIAFAPVLMSQQQGYPLCENPPSYSPIFMSVYGNSSCNKFNMNGTTCPPSIDGSWIELGTVLYMPESNWGLLEINFTPAQDINAICFGAACTIPPDYVNPPCTPYFFLDDIRLQEFLSAGEIELEVTGDLCSEDLALLAFADPPGGSFQWFFNGIAITGATSDILNLPPLEYKSGSYTVMYSLGGECLLDSVNLTWELPLPTVEEVFICSGETATCAGEQFQDEGSFEVILPSYSGCDSVVTCLIEVYPEIPLTSLTLDVCGPTTMSACGQDFSQSGIYTLVCTDFHGCDSLVELTLNVLEPVSIIVDPGFLGCDSTGSIQLDGSQSSQNASNGGDTHYHWTGPVGGIQGTANSPTVNIVLPGIYCLEVFHINNGATCSNLSCVEVFQSVNEPDVPVLTVLNTACIGSTLQVVASPGGPELPAEYSWILPSDLILIGNQDSSVLVTSWIPGNHKICVFALNGCGHSDTICHPLFFTSFDTSYLKKKTCDPALVAIDTVILKNGSDCDSLVITQTDLLPSSIKNLQVYTCDPAQAGLDTLHLMNYLGCDSTVFVTTTYTSIYQESQTIQICGNGTAYSDTLTIVSSPCDSLFITDYVYSPLDTVWQLGTTCQSVLAGMFINVFPDENGCDSMIITEITLLPSDTTFVEGVTCDKANELYHIETFANQWGCDSTVWTSIMYIGVDTQFVQKTSCDPAQVGVVIQTIPGTFCDTIRVAETTWVPFTESLDTITLCMPSGPASDTLILVGQSGCDSLAIRIYRYTDLQAEVGVQKETCAERSDGEIQVQTTDGGDPPYSYRLDVGPWQQTGTFAGLPPGMYTLEIKDQNDCLLQADGQIIEAGSTLTLDAGPDRTEKLGAVINLSVQASAQLAEIQWTASDPLSCTSCSQSALGPLTTSQMVSVTGVSVEGCPGQDDLSVEVSDRLKVYIPNSFSPDNDGINDFFSVYSNDENARVKNLAIYDRWGNALFYQQDLPVNDPSAGWDGMFRGKVLDPGVYIYVIELALSDVDSRIYKGDVQIVR
ncbi:MAG: gliding motility-associated C-terminal domain-containing protein [Saprospiraceae bacterium]|nr:gliding motility-associated C-terminal domain-containing protein [Saprospiraceae bacterium]